MRRLDEAGGGFRAEVNAGVRVRVVRAAVGDGVVVARQNLVIQSATQVRRETAVEVKKKVPAFTRVQS